MSSARRLYRLYLAVAAAGGAALLVALAAVGHTVTLARPSVQAWVAACGRLLLPRLTPVTMTVLVVIGIAVAVTACGLRSLTRQLRASRRYIRVRRGRAVTGGRGAFWVFDDPEPQAFCAGYLRPRVYLSTGARAALTGPELDAVLAHERHHARRRDPLRLLLARTAADALFFVPALKRLVDRYAALAELAADEAAFGPAKDHQPLAAALLVFGEHDGPAGVVGIAPERVDHLLGEAPRWRVPSRVLAGSALIVVALIAVPVLVAAGGTSVDLPMLAARSCMLVMAGVTASLLISAGLASRAVFSRR